MTTTHLTVGRFGESILGIHRHRSCGLRKAETLGATREEPDEQREFTRRGGTTLRAQVREKYGVAVQIIPTTTVRSHMETSSANGSSGEWRVEGRPSSGISIETTVDRCCPSAGQLWTDQEVQVGTRQATFTAGTFQRLSTTFSCKRCEEHRSQCEKDDSVTSRLRDHRQQPAGEESAPELKPRTTEALPRSSSR